MPIDIPGAPVALSADKHADLGSAGFELLALVEASPDAIYSRDLDGLITSWNPAAEDLFGYSAVEAIGSPFSLILPPEFADEGRRILDATKAGRRLAPYETTRIAKDGRVLDISLSIAPLRDAQGESTGAVAVARNITNQKRADADLEIQRAAYQAVFDGAADGIVVTDEEGVLCEANPAACAMFGLERADLTGRKIFDFVPPELHGHIKALRERSLADGSLSGELDLLRADGSRLPVEYTRTANFLPGRDLSIVRDISERQRSERALRVSESRLEAIVAHTPAVVYVKSADDFTFLLVNREFEELFGLEAGDALGKTDEAILGPDAARTVHANDLEVLEAGRPMVREEVVPAYGGENRTYLSVKFPLPDAEGRPYAVCGISTDITARKRDDVELARSRQILAESQRLAAIGSWEWEIATGRVDWSDELYRIFGVCADEFDPTYEAFIGFIHPDDRPDVEAAIERALAEHSFEWEARIVRSDGETRMLHTYAEVILDESGAPAVLRGSAQDVTERKVAEGAQRQSELRYRQIVETTNEGIWMIDAQGKTTFANARMAEMLGCSDAELLSRSFLDFTDEAGAQEALERFQQRADGTEDVHDFRFIRKDGSELWALLATNQLTNESGEYTGALAMVADITDRVRMQQESASLERQLQRGQRLESVGLLAGGIAHDFNNLLAVILSYATFASEELEAGHPAAGDVAEISRAADRAAVLTRQLLIFSRRETVRPDVVVLNEVVGDVERMLARTLGEHVELQTDLTADLWPTLVDVGQMEAVLVNLAVNARDAMPEGGVLTVATCNVTLDETYAERQLDARPGRYVHLSVTDTGEGMEQSTVDQAFEPFFTTKALGEGTGLGLATAYGVVTQAGGHIRLYSEPGRGTSVQIHLPACEAATAARADRSRSETVTGGTGETVLVVEDEDAMREVTRRILTQHGYSVVTAAGPLEALRICNQHHNKIDLLLTDVVMPKMLGPELSRHIAALRPETKIAFMSGYSGKAEALNDAAAEVLEKPFTATALLEAVRQALNGDLVS